jgi:hypothetical protein
MHTRKGKFAPTYINWVDRTPEEQAAEILDLIADYHAKGYTKVGITYSANHDQSIAINKTYQENNWQTNTRGGNQAAVITALEKLLVTEKYCYLQNVFRILPISTCAKIGGKGAVENAWLAEELLAIDSFLKENNLLLGWQDGISIKNKEAPFAVGGGISKQLTEDQNEMIQGTLLNFMEKYPEKAFEDKAKTKGLSLIAAATTYEEKKLDESSNKKRP